MFGSMPASTAALFWHLACVLAVPLATSVLVADGSLSRWEGGLLLSGFAAWLLATMVGILHARAPADSESDSQGAPRPAWLLFLLVVGVAMLAGAGRLFAEGGSELALLLDVPDAVVGATVVALGTSMPELMTTLVARWRGHHDVGLGTLLGSSLFNGLAILGTAALISPVRPPLLPVWVMLAFGGLAVLLVVPRQGRLSRLRGAAMLVCYALYVAVLALAPGVGAAH